jgi:trehalose 6-phosphate phosphatase
MDAPRAEPVVSAPVPAIPPSEELGRRLAPSPLLVALDIDGTLAPIASTPAGAAVPELTKVTLRCLTRLEQVQVALVTGRSAPDGQRMVELPGTWIIGNHGMEWIEPGGAIRVNNAAREAAPRIAAAAAMLNAQLHDIRGAIIEDKRWTLSVHFRLASPSDRPTMEQALDDVARRLDLRVTHGKQVYELRPPVEITKGTALLELARVLGIRDGVGALFYAGDDRTDEDAFRALRGLANGAVTVHVGGEAAGDLTTSAEFSVPDPAALRQLLDWLVLHRGGRTPVSAA